MRLLMVNNEFPPLGGGTGTVNRALLERFRGIEELQVDLITSTMGNQIEEEFLSERIRLLRLPVFKSNIHHAANVELLVFAIRAFLVALKEQRARPYDLCFAWSAVPAGGVAFALLRLVGLRYIVRVCGPDIPGFEKRYWKLYPFLTPVIKTIWRFAEVVIAKCEEEADLIRTVDERIKPAIIPNGTDLAGFQPGDRSEQNGALRLLCVARLIQRKGQAHLIEAVAQLVKVGCDVHLDLVGTGDAEADYQSLVHRLGIADRVRFHGYVPREKIPQHYASAQVFVLASYNEAMSVAALEAMAAGLPIVLTRTGGASELVEEGINGFTFDWGDVNALVGHLRKLTINRSLAKEMGVASREKATKLSWDGIAENYLELLTSLTKAQEYPPSTQAALL